MGQKSATVVTLRCLWVIHIYTFRDGCSPVIQITTLLVDWFQSSHTKGCPQLFFINHPPLLITSEGPVGPPLGAIDFMHSYNSDVVQNRQESYGRGLTCSLSCCQPPVSYNKAVVQ